MTNELPRIYLVARYAELGDDRMLGATLYVSDSEESELREEALNKWLKMFPVSEGYSRHAVRLLEAPNSIDIQLEHDDGRPTEHYRLRLERIEDGS